MFNRVKLCSVQSNVYKFAFWSVPHPFLIYRYRKVFDVQTRTYLFNRVSNSEAEDMVFKLDSNSFHTRFYS